MGQELGCVFSPGPVYGKCRGRDCRTLSLTWHLDGMGLEVALQYVALQGALSVPFHWTNE